MAKTKPVILSGIQPSGVLNIAHYIGALQNWAKLQHAYEALYCIVDLHTITVKQDPEQLRKHCYDILALYIACGIDPKKSHIFLQSHVPEHAQLAWVLNCYTYMGELNRMTQFKDKSKQHESNINVGLFDYPVLMTADILLYDADFVPVGDDQTQHLELARDIALRFNNLYGDVFIVPKMYNAPIGGRIMSLQEPLKKMSKSDPNEHSYITLLDDADTVRQKMKRAVTDSGKDIYLDLENKPGIANLLTIFAAITQQSIDQIQNQYRNAVGYSAFKNDIAEALITFLQPIQKIYYELRSDQKLLDKILDTGAQVAHEKANKTLQRAHEAIGFVLPHRIKSGHSLNSV